MREGEVKIYYQGFQKAFDDAFIELMEAFGLECWASGYDFEEGVRDLAFRPRSEGADEN